MEGFEMSFKEYADAQYEKALLDPNFNINGNSPRATYHQSFIKRMFISTTYLSREVLVVVKRSPMEYTIGEVLSLILVIPLFPVFIILRAIFGKRNAKKEIEQEYKRSLK